MDRAWCIVLPVLMAVGVLAGLLVACTRSGHGDPSPLGAASAGEPVEPSETLRQHLARTRSGARFDLMRLDTAIPGWDHFLATEEEVLDAPPACYTVRDGTVVAQDQRAAAFQDLVRHLDLLTHPEAAPAADLAHAAACLLTQGQLVLTGNDLPRWGSSSRDDPPQPPTVRATATGAELVFWARSSGRGVVVRRHTVLVTPGPVVTLQVGKLAP